jgi:hypothetical protein
VLARSEETVAQCFVLDYGVCRRGRCNHVPTYKSRSRAWTWKLVMDGGACGRRGFSDACSVRSTGCPVLANQYLWVAAAVLHAWWLHRSDSAVSWRLCHWPTLDAAGTTFECEPPNWRPPRGLRQLSARNSQHLMCTPSMQDCN